MHIQQLDTKRTTRLCFKTTNRTDLLLLRNKTAYLRCRHVYKLRKMHFFVCMFLVLCACAHAGACEAGSHYTDAGSCTSCAENIFQPFAGQGMHAPLANTKCLNGGGITCIPDFVAHNFNSCPDNTVPVQDPTINHFKIYM